MSEAIITRLDRIVFLLEKMDARHAQTHAQPAQPVVAAAAPISVPPPAIEVKTSEHKKSAVSDEVYYKSGSDILRVVMGIRSPFTADLLASELNLSPSTTAKIIRRLSEDHLVQVKHDILVVTDEVRAGEWVNTHSPQSLETKKMEIYDAKRCAEIVRLLLSGEAVLQGRNTNALIEELKLSRSITERLVRKILECLPFVMKASSPNSPLRVRPEQIELAQEWVEQVDQLPNEGDTDVRGVSDEMFLEKAPRIVYLLLDGTKNTVDLMRETGTKYHSLRAILHRLNGEGLGVKIGIAPRGTPPPVTITNQEAAELWLSKMTSPPSTKHVNGVGIVHAN